MKQKIALLLAVVWVLLFLLLCAEPTSDTTTVTTKLPEWTGLLYVGLLLGIPFIFINLIKK